MNLRSDKKILCFTDSFNSGGAQKQLMMLANGLIEEKFEVATLQYFNLNFFSEFLDKKIIRLTVSPCGKALRVIKILYRIFSYNPDCIITFLHGPNNYAALYKIIFFWRKTRLITGERNLDNNGLCLKDLLLRTSHLFAFKVVCNSNAQKLIINKYFNDKVLFIPNGTSLNNIKVKDNYNPKKNTLKLIVPARFSHQKNPINLLKALVVLNTIQNLKVEIFWYGRFDFNEVLYLEAKSFIDNNKLENNFFFHSACSNIYEEMIKYDAIILPSFYEGCPNAIIDGMLCGMPVLASKISDNQIYLSHQIEFLFDPNAPSDFVEKIHGFSKLNALQKKQLGMKNRKLAESYFNINKMVNSYIGLLQ